MHSNRCNVFITTLLLFYSVIVLTGADHFDPKKHVTYEMYCRFSNHSTDTTLEDIDSSILENDNLIMSDDNGDRRVKGVQNCGWNWHPFRPTRIFIHGYYSDHNTLMSYARAYLERGDFNFIAINWLRGAKTINYVKARHRVIEVGQAVARFIDYLVTLGLDLNDLTCVGHSLGAHCCGIMGKSLRSGQLANIIALDPALPLFKLKDENCRLHYNDAKYVQVIHTSGGYLGVKHPIGHADFYPNFGCTQPSCYNYVPFVGEICSHIRVHDLFLESLKYTSKFVGTKCMTYGEIYDRQCTEHGEFGLMGGEISNENRPFGLYYLQTNGKSPYSMYHL